MSQVRLIIALAAVPFVVWLFLPVQSNGQQLQRKIEDKRKAIESKKRRERSLTSTIEGYSRRINLLQGDISTLQARQVKIEADLAAKRAAGDRDVLVHGVTTARLALAAGVLDELELHVVPVLLGQGRRLFDGLGAEHIELERTRVLEGEHGVIHLHYRVRR